MTVEPGSRSACQSVADVIFRPSIAPPQQGPNLDPNAPDKYRQELSKYTLEGWLGIGQCVTRFLEDDRSSISSEAYESLGGSLDTGTPVSCSWEGELADVAAVQHQHVADDWGYGSSRLGAQPEEAAGLRGVPAVDNRSQWKPAVQDQSAGVPDAQVAEFMKAVSEAREQVSEQRPDSNSEAPGVASTSGAARADYDAGSVLLCFVSDAFVRNVGLRMHFEQQLVTYQW